MTSRRKRIRMVVEVSCPIWLTAAQARTEVRSLINHCAFWGHRPRIGLDEVDEKNFRAAAIRPMPDEAADLVWVRDQILSLCEHTEDDPSLVKSITSDNAHERGFARGRISEANGIRRAMAEVIRLRLAGG